MTKKIIPNVELTGNLDPLIEETSAIANVVIIIRAESGDVAIILINGCDAIVEKIIKGQNGISLIDPPRFEPKYYEAQEINEFLFALSVKLSN